MPNSSERLGFKILIPIEKAAHTQNRVNSKYQAVLGTGRVGKAKCRVCRAPLGSYKFTSPYFEDERKKHWSKQVDQCFQVLE